MSTVTSRRNLPVIGTDIPFSSIEDQYCRVLYWDDSPISSSGSIIPTSKTHPYGFIEIEGKNIPESALLYLSTPEDCQTIDLIAVRAVLDMQYKKDEADLLIFWTKKHYKAGTDTQRSDLPKLRVFAFHKGFYFFQKNKGTAADYGNQSVPYEEFCKPIVWAQSTIMV